jgi:hypothetical protein
VAAHILWAWVLTIPAAAAMSALTYSIVVFGILRLPTAGQVVVEALVVLLLVKAFLAWRRTAGKH